MDGSLKKGFGSAIALMLTAALLLGCSSGSQQGETNEAGSSGQGLIEGRVSTWHSLDRITSESKTAGEWASTVSRMVEKGARLNEEEQQVGVEYLAETYGP